MMVNKEFALVVNVIMGQNTGSVLHTALRGEGVSNVELLFGLSEDDIDRIKFRSPHSLGMLVEEPIGNALKALLKTFRIFFYNKLSKGFKIHQNKQNPQIQGDFRKFAIAAMGTRKYYVAHGHVYLDNAVYNCDVCPLCRNGNFFLECTAYNEDEDDVDLLVVDLSTRVHFNDNKISDDPVKCDEFENMPLVAITGLQKVACIFLHLTVRGNNKHLLHK